MWTSVKDKIPTKDGEYLVTLNIGKYQFVSIVSFTQKPYELSKYDFYEYKGKKTDGIFYTCDPEYGYSDYCNKEITAWCELPEPYKGE